MVKSSPTPFRSGRQMPHPPVQEAQLALAVADESFLRSLLTDSLPAIAHPMKLVPFR